MYCLPVLYIDGTFLTGRYKGTILTAIGVDCNKQVVPIAFAFVENENTESWYWFLERVKIQIVAARLDVCLISDRHAGLLAAIRQLHEESRGQPPLWPDVGSRWCIRHTRTVARSAAPIWMEHRHGLPCFWWAGLVLGLWTGLLVDAVLPVLCV